MLRKVPFIVIFETLGCSGGGVAPARARALPLAKVTPTTLATDIAVELSLGFIAGADGFDAALVEVEICP